MIGAPTFNSSYLSPPISHSVELSSRNFIEAILKRHFNPGKPVLNVGLPKLIQNRDLKSIGAHQHYIKGDGSCWARALWQVVFNQILKDPEEFDHFIERAIKSEKDMNVPVEYIKGTIYILYTLKNQSQEERFDYLNHQNVDTTLIYFMRHVAGEFMEKNFTIYDKPTIRQIKTNLNKYGGPEINAFARYFNIETHTVNKDENGPYANQWVYRIKQKDSNTSETATPIVKLEFNLGNNVLMFGSSSNHFEVLSFVKEAEKNQMNLDRLLAEQLQIKESENCCGSTPESSSECDSFDSDPSEALNWLSTSILERQEELKRNEKVLDAAALAKKIQEEQYAIHNWGGLTADQISSLQTCVNGDPVILRQTGQDLAPAPKTAPLTGQEQPKQSLTAKLESERSSFKFSFTNCLDFLSNSLTALSNCFSFLFDWFIKSTDKDFD